MISFKFAACCDYLERDGWEMEILDGRVLFHKEKQHIWAQQNDAVRLEEAICKIKASEAANQCRDDIARIEKEITWPHEPMELPPPAVKYACLRCKLETDALDQNWAVYKASETRHPGGQYVLCPKCALIDGLSRLLRPCPPQHTS
ncbi:MAG: hypothetical protein E6Q97_29395 [Desulfurellales bacterium]|nr:MAG: hypothetical protein E6Q97_29395 [Desulfurellales bacterium]